MILLLSFIAVLIITFTHYYIEGLTITQNLGLKPRPNASGTLRCKGEPGSNLERYSHFGLEYDTKLCNNYE